MRKFNIGLQYFGEPAQNQEEGGQNAPQQLNFDELYKTNEDFKSFVATEASKAIADYQQKQQLLNDKKISEAEKLKTMTAEEKAEYFQKKYEASELEKQRMLDSEALKSQTAKLLSDNGLPAEFISDFDFTTATADSVKNRIKFLSGYEIYPKGTFETKVNNAISEKLKQKAPESGSQGGSQVTDKLRSYFGL